MGSHSLASRTALLCSSWIFLCVCSASLRYLCVWMVWNHKATMQLDPLAEALAYRKMCNYILFHGMMSSLQNNYKHLNQAEKFFRREWEREGQLCWLRLIYKVCICGQSGKTPFLLSGWHILPLGTSSPTHLVSRKGNRPCLPWSEEVNWVECVS